LFGVPPGRVHVGSPAGPKVALFGALFVARADIYAQVRPHADSGPAQVFARWLKRRLN
jgi:hypothetical protein